MNFDRLLRRTPLQRIFARRATTRLTVLAFHQVMAVEQFEHQLDYLAEVANPVDLAQVIAALDGGSLPPRAVLVTFDDGDRSVLDQASPLLAAHRIPAVAFVCTGYLDTDRPFWWAEVGQIVGPARAAEIVRRLKQVPDSERVAEIDRLRRTATTQPMPQLETGELAALEAAGIAIGNHTVSHPLLDRCDDRQLDTEIRAAHAHLTESLGRSPVSFAYPNGNWDPRAEPILSQLGYRIAFSFDHRQTSLPPPNPLRVSRVRVNDYTSLDRFALILSGLHPFLHRLRGRD